MLMGNVLDRRMEWIDRRRSRVGEQRKRSAEAANKLTRLYAAIEDGLVGQGAEGLKDRIRELEAIKIMGGRTELLRTMAASAGDQSALVEVRSFRPKWRTRHDSNV